MRLPRSMNELTRVIPKKMTLKECIGILSSAGIKNARDEARLLFREIGKIPAYALVSENAECDSDELILAVSRRTKREPLQYIIGEVDFFKERYEVTPDCLIPRPDTEILVEYAVNNIPDGAYFLDLCTGSGCVAVSTLKNTKNTRATAYELVPETAELARRNAQRNGVTDRLRVKILDLMSSIPEESGVYAVLSNPPYVAEPVYTELDDEIFHEPKAAFVGGADGADFYRRFVPIYKKVISDDGFMAFEIGYDQGALMFSLAEENGLSIEIIKDFSGNDRVAVMKRR